MTIGPKTLGMLVVLSVFGAGRETAAEGAADAAKAHDIASARSACPKSCDDGNPCTVDSCDRHGHCRHVDLARCRYSHAATLPLPSGSSCTPIPSCAIPDHDGDGLNDAWEIQGGIDLDCDGDIDPARGDLRLPGADPDRPNVYLEYDYMVLPDQGTACTATADCAAGQGCVEGICRGHSHRPHRQAIRAVVDAFARQGIALHVDRGHALPHSTVVTFDPVFPPCAGNDAVNFYDLKARFFDARRTLAYHYAVFGHYHTCDSAVNCSVCTPAVAVGSGGRAELPGNDLIVATGGFLDAGITPGVEHEAGLLMHELGHNLALRHGGNEHLPDFKPNYLSAMNDSFVYTGIGIADAPGSASPIACHVKADCPPEAICGSFSHVCTRIDYSSQELPTLSEDDLDENVGIGAGTNDITHYVCPEFTEGFGVGVGPIDWDCNGDATASHVMADINADGGTGTLRTLTGWADWPHLQLAFQCTAAGSANGLPLPRTAPPRELTLPEAMSKHVLHARRNATVQAVPGAPGERPIAILGTDDLEVADIDGSSLKLAGARPVRIRVADINGDGRADLVLTFDGAGARGRSPSRPLRLTGWLKNSQAFDADVRP